jgi:predicted acylesterase/phospholipase RssA
MSDPRTYDYGQATRNADLVMKGGITSGVVYPHAVCEIARTFRLRNVGGTSAGAIAAAAAAAAERGRASGGFARLAALPAWLGAGTNLVSLFQAQPPTRRAFAVFTAGMGSRRRRWAILVAAVRRFWNWALVGALPGVALAALAVLDGSLVHRLAAVLAPLVLAVAGAGVAVVIGLYRDVVHGVPDNLFGLCTGMAGTSPAAAGDATALTPWLSGVLDDLAGLDGGGPVTFGHLQQADVNLEMVATSLTHGRPYRLPFRQRGFFFDPDEFRRLFPERIVTWMADHPPASPAEPAAAQDWELYCRLLAPLRPLPDAENLPVVVATRLSLSFPGLISAVPLWSVDFTRTANQGASNAWSGWLRVRRGEWTELREREPSAWPDAPTEHYRPERCWFSDGGIVSNFPVHFFDQALPQWPTFAINLRPFHPDWSLSTDQCANVWMPDSNSGGIAEWWTRWADDGRDAVAGFGRAILTAMQNWSDNTQLRVPGYRDRVAHVSHTPTEGGMNLTMDGSTVLALTERGRCAGEQLSARFHEADPPGRLTWDNHRWVRFRSTMSMLDQMLRQAAEAYAAPSTADNETPYPQLVARGATVPPPSYRWVDAGQRSFALKTSDELMATVDNWQASAEGFVDGSPQPSPRLRIMPEW